MRVPLLLSAIASLTLFGCPQAAPEPNPAGNVGMACTEDTDCQTPMSYLIRSSCPFTSLCTAGKCAVACPMASKGPQVSASDAWKDACDTDADCDCSDFSNGTGSVACSCHEGLCYAVVK